MEDFLYLCDDAYDRGQILAMERQVLLVVDYDINAPVAYRFLRRLARVSHSLFIYSVWSMFELFQCVYVSYVMEV